MDCVWAGQKDRHRNCLSSVKIYFITCFQKLWFKYHSNLSNITLIARKSSLEPHWDFFFLISLGMKMFSTLHKLQDFPSLSKRESFRGRIPTPRHKRDQMRAFPARLCPKVQTNWSPFYEISFLYTLTVMPARQDVCNNLHKLPYFEKSIVGVKTENRRN